MRPLQAVLVALAATVLLLSSVGARAEISDPGAPKYATRLMVDFVAPTVSPGQTAGFSFKVNNSYADATAVMTNVTVTAGIYRYATQDESRDVNDSFPHPPLIDGESLEIVRNLPTLGQNQSTTVSFDIETSGKTPHGSYFTQSTYFLRFILVFNFQGNSTPIVFKSKGFFTEEQWNTMTPTVNGTSELNLTYMRSLGVDGLIPDSSFGLKQPIPRWPLALLVAACVFIGFLIAYYFVLDNPGKYPRLEKRFYYLRGKLGESRRHLKDRRRK